ncbi:MAG: molecular chaperone, partial [Pseudomonadota bacterium]|nr:molecular chaperone [Pseudomonadota bacterium]
MHFSLIRRTLLTLTAALLLPQAALADLMLFPTRLVFDKNQRTAQVDLINNGSEPATYRITLVNQRMGEDGQFLPVDTSPPAGELFASDMLQYSPRQVTLQPGTSQTVRVMVRKPASLAAGEYRSHLHFEKMAAPRGATSVEAGKEKEIGIVLTALIGASIPVIVRHEVAPAGVTLSHLELLTAAAPAQPATLALQFDRTGASSVYGDLAVGFAPRGGAEQIVARAAGVAVYSPNPLRRARLALQAPAGTALAHGTLRVT